MGNTTNTDSPRLSSSSPSPQSSSSSPLPRSSIHRQDSATKEIHISTNHVDGFHYTGELLSGTVRIPRSFLHRHLTSIKHRTPAEALHKRSLRSAIMIELVGDATYSAEIDTAADSDGHVVHKVNLCRERCIVTINQNRLASETLVHSSSSPDSISTSINAPAIIHGTFQIQIPDDLPPSLANEHSPSVVYSLELSISSSRSRYQIPLVLSSKGSIPHPMTGIELHNSIVNRNNIHLRASVAKIFYRPGEQIPVRINYSNPQKRSVRSITVRLVQIYHIHNDQNHLQIDGKEWTFDTLTTLPQREWIGEASLQLFDRQLQASYPSHYVGTTQTIECALHYAIVIELTERKGDDVQLTLSPIQITYQV
ncbi:unnamed protein product [Adineta ricciae]|uniref:Arrestin C-terminal-like domain-containing protein n=1 Tax=Adineta ricciae TaxID=249248 RepID=A0A815G2A5_ADIRI|nr:unnamed protein product [Adineta ricciae]